VSGFSFSAYGDVSIAYFQLSTNDKKTTTRGHRF